MVGVGSSASSKFQQGEVTVAREKLGETVRESSRICRWLRDEEWWPRATGPRRAAAGDGSVRRRLENRLKIQAKGTTYCLNWY